MNIGGDELLSDNREWIKERYCHIGGGGGGLSIAK